MLDYLIIGFGLSGAALAFKMEEKGKSFMVIDDGKINSSKVAGGMMNPVILKRFTLAWKADEQLIAANDFYGKLEEKLGATFLQSVELYRKFATVEEQNNWFEAADNRKLAPFLDTKVESQLNPAIPSAYGFGQVRGAKRLDTITFLNVAREYLAQKGNLQTENFNYADLEIEEEGVSYNGLKARTLIFCEGFGIRNNPFFRYLPLTGNKGEYIIINSPELKLQTTIKASVFISPAGGENYVVGATYNNSDKSLGATEAAREELETKFQNLINVPYKVIGQVAGIRPSTVDRRPLVGRHPEHEHLFCCNGFGSRGVLIAPTVAEDLLGYIEQDVALPEEINLSRFTRKWYPERS